MQAWCCELCGKQAPPRRQRSARASDAATSETRTMVRDDTPYRDSGDRSQGSDATADSRSVTVSLALSRERQGERGQRQP
eukprot:4699653-Prymnesium_polylepis.2